MNNDNVCKKNITNLSRLVLPITASLITFSAMQVSAMSTPTELATADNVINKSAAWWDNFTNILDDRNGNEGRASSRETWVEFDFGAEYNNFDISFLEDNVYPYAVSRWKVQGWQNNQWVDLPAAWESHNSDTFQPAYPINANYTTSKMRITFQASSDNRVGLNELNILGTPVGAAPKAIADTDFYTAPTSRSTWRNFVNYYGVDNTDRRDDSRLLQRAIDDISALPQGGVLYIPNGDYYFESVQMRSNVHLDIAQGVTIYPTPNDDGRNHQIFHVGTGSPSDNPKVENFSIIGRGNGFTVDFRQSDDPNLAVFNLADVDNFKISNFTIRDNKTLFASLLINVRRNGANLDWPHNGIIEKINQTNALFGYGIVQTYGADNILFRDLHGQGGITLRMETDNLLMKQLKQGGIRDIYAQNISGVDCLAPVMFGPHFIENGSVQIDGVTSEGCGFAVRVDKGFVELFSPAGEVHDRTTWRNAVNADIGAGCSGTPYARGNGGTRWAARINDIGNCLQVVYNKYGLKPGSFEDVNVFNVKANFGRNAELKQTNLDYYGLSNPGCNNVCLPSEAQWDRRGNVYLGPSLAGAIDKNIKGREFNFDVNIHDIETIGFPNNHHELIDNSTSSSRICAYYGVNTCSDNRWYKN